MLQGVVQTERDINNKKQREDVEDKKPLIRVILKHFQTAIGKRNIQTMHIFSVKTKDKLVINNWSITYKDLSYKIDAK